MNISEAIDVARLIREVRSGHPSHEQEDVDAAVQRLADRAGKALHVSPELILRNDS